MHSRTGSTDPIVSDSVQIIPMDEEMGRTNNGGSRRRASSGQWTGNNNNSNYSYQGYHTSDEGGQFRSEKSTMCGGIFDFCNFPDM